MAYNYLPQTYAPNYFQQQAYYPQMQQPVSIQQQPQQQQAPNPGLIFVQGENAAKSYLVAPNTTVLLMDSETQRFYIKSADASGMPLPLRIFQYDEVKPQKVESVESHKPVDMDNYVTKEELDKRLAELRGAKDE